MPATTDFQAPPRRFDDSQLAKLLEVSSAVKCECPNHLAKTVFGWVEFEKYSQDCLMENDDDREIHALLYRETSRAREIMEAALVDLLDFEKIEV